MNTICLILTLILYVGMAVGAGICFGKAMSIANEDRKENKKK